MKTLKELPNGKSSITAKLLKECDYIYHNRRIGFDESEKLYFIGQVWNYKRSFYSSVKELKEIL